VNKRLTSKGIRMVDHGLRHLDEVRSRNCSILPKNLNILTASSIMDPMIEKKFEKSILIHEEHGYYQNSHDKKTRPYSSLTPVPLSDFLYSFHSLVPMKLQPVFQITSPVPYLTNPLYHQATQKNLIAQVLFYR
jgi:hypothetical protein